MRKRKLGRTRYLVSELGIGTLGFGGDMWRGVEPRDAQRALYAAVDAGVDFVDTALVYGAGLAEKLVGQVIRELRARDHVVVASKVPPLNETWPAQPRVPLERVFHPEHVQASVEQSLRNLRAEAIPLAQLHVWHDDWLASSAWPDVRGRMQLMIKQGKVLHWGVSVNSGDPDSALAILDEPLIETVQAVYNLFDRTCEAAFLERARDREVAVIARSPLDEGGLSGRLTRDSTFPKGDFRGRYFAGERLAQVVERVAALTSLCADEVASVPEMALRFILSRPEVAVVIPGMRRREHVRDNIAAVARGALSNELLERLQDHAWERNWYLEANRDHPVT